MLAALGMRYVSQTAFAFLTLWVLSIAAAVPILHGKTPFVPKLVSTVRRIPRHFSPAIPVQRAVASPSSVTRLSALFFLSRVPALMQFCQLNIIAAPNNYANLFPCRNNFTCDQTTCDYAREYYEWTTATIINTTLPSFAATTIISTATATTPTAGITTSFANDSSCPPASMSVKTLGLGLGLGMGLPLFAAALCSTILWQMQRKRFACAVAGTTPAMTDEVGHGRQHQRCKAGHDLHELQGPAPVMELEDSYK